MYAKLVTAAVAAATLATASIATPSQAEAGSRGAAVAAGIVGGVILGAAVASHARPRYYEPAPAYYEEPRYVYAPTCRRVLVEDHYGNAYWRKVCR